MEGSRIVTEAWGDNLLIYLYDESGAPIGMQYRNTTYAKDRFDTFYFEKNLQGDVVAVYNSMGDPVVYYSYDAWGNQTITWRNSYGPNFNASYNPFRYRGYYYDTETGLYYLQSRYYNPQWGRFLNADGLVSTGQGLLGYNMYAYCNNNPVMGYDPLGYSSMCNCIACMAGLPDECTQPLSEPAVDPSPSQVTSFSKLDLAQYRWNAFEEAVIQADGFAWYRGAPVIKLPFWPFKEEAFSFGALFIGSEITTANTIKHEYGHYRHFQQIGLPAYTVLVAIPSLYGYWTNVPYEDYYRQPCEYVADELGNAERPAGYLSAEDIARGEQYYRMTRKAGRGWRGNQYYPFY